MLSHLIMISFNLCNNCVIEIFSPFHRGEFLEEESREGAVSDPILGLEPSSPNQSPFHYQEISLSAEE